MQILTHLESVSKDNYRTISAIRQAVATGLGLGPSTGKSPASLRMIIVERRNDKRWNNAFIQPVVTGIAVGLGGVRHAE